MLDMALMAHCGRHACQGPPDQPRGRSGRLKGVGRLTGEDGQLVPYEAEQEEVHGNVLMGAQEALRLIA
jgi:hypothetical protein